MNLAVRFESVTGRAWIDLGDELDAWAEQGRVARLWWRDDDAVAPTPQLEALIELADGVPLGLAVIPAMARPDLADVLDSAPQVAVLQHGWRHANHAGAGKKSEFPATAPPTKPPPTSPPAVTASTELFGDRFLPVLAPPWNRFAVEFAPLLSEAGLIDCQAGAAPRADASPGSRRPMCISTWSTGTVPAASSATKPRSAASSISCAPAGSAAIRTRRSGS